MSRVMPFTMLVTTCGVNEQRNEQEGEQAGRGQEPGMRQRDDFCTAGATLASPLGMPDSNSLDEPYYGVLR